MLVLAPSRLLLTEVQPGQLWRVEGQPEPKTIIVNGFKLTESTIKPTVLALVRPSGEHIVQLLANGSDFQGIDLVKARKLWDRFGDTLYRILDEGNRDALTEVLPEALADTLIAAWERWGNTLSLQWLQTNHRWRRHRQDHRAAGTDPDRTGRRGFGFPHGPVWPRR